SRDLARATAHVEHRSATDGMAVEDRLFLRPDRLCLRRKIAHHRLVGHFLGLRTAGMLHTALRYNTPNSPAVRFTLEHLDPARTPSPGRGSTRRACRRRWRCDCAPFSR